jgi:hypothetical protein
VFADTELSIWEGAESLHAGHQRTVNLRRRLMDSTNNAEIFGNCKTGDFAHDIGSCCGVKATENNNTWRRIKSS